MAIIDYFDKSVIIQRVTVSSNGMGGQSKSWATNLTIDAMIDYLGGQKTQIAAQYADRATHILICAAGKDITVSDRAVYNSEVYRILHVDTPFSNHMEILLEYVGVDNND